MSTSCSASTHLHKLPRRLNQVCDRVLQRREQGRPVQQLHHHPVAICRAEGAGGRYQSAANAMLTVGV